MCGIAGWIDYQASPENAGRLLEGMKRAIWRRGPDEEGSYVDARAAIGMQRLAIIDLAGGRQPMANEDGTIWIVFNGEIYNYPRLRPELERKGHRFATDSDTEAILHLYEEVGDECPAMLEGMFAFCIWDTRRGRALLARDRLGKKPLYYTQSVGGLLFGSELKALLCHPGLSREIDLQALDTYLALNYTLAPRTMLREVRQVRPGHRLVFEGGQVRESAYWTLRKGAPTARRPRGDAVEAFLETFGQAVRERLLSDVPLGAFLSGGIDSSAVVATMQRAMGAPARTFCLAFKEQSWGEQDYARQVARYVGAAHQESEVPGEPLADALPRIVAALDEPHGDTSAVPMYYLCQATRRGVTVALSGDGGDEVFAGYETYVADAVRPLYRKLPARVRTGIVGPLARALPASGKKLGADEMARRFVAGADLGGDEAHYAWRAIFGREERLGILEGSARDVAAEHDPLDDYLALCPHVDDFPGAQRYMYMDVCTWLPNDILVKVDRTSMAHSLEVRAPFLDHRLVELAFSLPPEAHLRGTSKKRLLRRAMRGLLPDEIIDRRKRGFSAPVGAWMTGSLRDLVYDTVASRGGHRLPYFAEGAPQRLVAGHDAGAGETALQVWGLLTFHLWHDWMRSLEGVPLGAPVVAGAGAESKAI